jgi:hypothetical protein
MTGNRIPARVSLRAAVSGSSNTSPSAASMLTLVAESAKDAQSVIIHFESR